MTSQQYNVINKQLEKLNKKICCLIDQLPPADDDDPPPPALDFNLVVLNQWSSPGGEMLLFPTNLNKGIYAVSPLGVETPITPLNNAFFFDYDPLIGFISEYNDRYIFNVPDPTNVAEIRFRFNTDIPFGTQEISFTSLRKGGYHHSDFSVGASGATVDIPVSFDDGPVLVVVANN